MALPVVKCMICSIPFKYDDCTPRIEEYINDGEVKNVLISNVYN